MLAVHTVTTSIEAMKKLATFSLHAMLQEVGPLALVQRAVEPSSLANFHNQLSRTVTSDGRPPVARHALSLMMGLDHGLVVPLGRDVPEGEVSLGRGADADVQLVDSSVSRLHAMVRFDAWKRVAWLRDLDTTNGSFVNGQRITTETPLMEGNIVTLGHNTAFLFLRTETLFAVVHSK